MVRVNKGATKNEPEVVNTIGQNKQRNDFNKEG